MIESAVAWRSVSSPLPVWSPSVSSRTLAIRVWMYGSGKLLGVPCFDARYFSNVILAITAQVSSVDWFNSLALVAMDC